MTVRVFTHADGSVTVVVPAPGWELEKACAVTVAKNPHLAGLATVDVDTVALPGRRFRNCWRVTAEKVSVDLPLARAQRMAEIRKERDTRLSTLDGEWTKSTARGDALTAAAVDAKRQTLRDVPQVATALLAAMTTPEDIAAYEPAWP